MKVANAITVSEEREPLENKCQIGLLGDALDACVYSKDDWLGTSNLPATDSILVQP